MATQSTGIRSYFATVAEATPGTTPASPALVAVPRISDTLQKTRGFISSSALYSDRMSRNVRLGNIAVGGNVSVEYAPNSFDNIIEAAMRSAWATNSVSPGVTDKSLTVEIGHPDVGYYDQFTGCRVNKFTLNVPSGNNYVTAEVEFMGENGTTGSSSIDTAGGIDDALAGVPFVHLDGTFNEGGSAVAYFTGLQVVMDNNMQANYALGSAGARSVTHGMFKCTGQITAYYESNTLAAKWMGETMTALTFTLNSGVSSQTWSMPNCKLTSMTKPTSGQGPTIITFGFEALKVGTTPAITITRVV